MIINSVIFRSVLPKVWLGFIVMLLPVMEPAPASATDIAEKELSATVKQCMEAMWTGKAFGPELELKQQQMKIMLEAGAPSKAELEAIVKRLIPDLMNRHTTSRYYLEEMSGRIDELFSSRLEWDEIKKMLWEEMASVVKDGEQMIIRVGTLAPRGTPWLNVPEKMLIPHMEQLSDGKITLKLYGGGTMGEDDDILRKIDVGQLDVCGATTLGMLTASPESAVFLLPGLFKNYEEVDHIYKTFRKRIDAGFAEKGYILAALIDTGHFHIYSKKRITGLADVRKQKVLSCWGTIEQTVFNELGISSIPVAVPEVMSALSTGLADTNLAPAAWMLGMQAYQYAGYYLTPPLLYSPAVVIMGVRAKERIQRQFKMSDTFTDNVQELLVFEVKHFEGDWKDQIRSFEARALHAFETRTGMKAMTFSAEDQAAIAQASIGVREKLVGRIFPEDLMNDVLNALEAYRKNQAQPSMHTY